MVIKRTQFEMTDPIAAPFERLVAFGNLYSDMPGRSSEGGFAKVPVGGRVNAAYYPSGRSVVETQSRSVARGRSGYAIREATGYAPIRETYMPEAVGLPASAKVTIQEVLERDRLLLEQEDIARKAQAAAAAADAQRQTAPVPTIAKESGVGTGKMGISINATGDGNMDLGQIITGLGTAYIQNKYAQPPVQYMPSVTPVGFDVPFTDYTIEGDIPFIDIGRQGKKRRRRKRLLTPTDFNDLAALKTLTGNNDAFKAAVMKAVRR